MKEIKKIFISGKITGDDDYKEKFATAKKHLQIMFPKASVVSPTDIDLTGMEYNKQLSICKDILITCDTICLLEDWYESKGAKIELAVALARELNVVTQFIYTSDEEEGYIDYIYDYSEEE